MSLLVLVCFACSRPPAPAPESAVVAAAAAPTPAGAPAAVERLTITLDPSETSYDEAAKVAHFSPDSRRQAADYTTYDLDLTSLEAALGGRPAAPVSIVVEVGPPSVETYVPDDPNLPAPSGGFRYIRYTGRVVGRAQ